MYLNSSRIYIYFFTMLLVSNSLWMSNLRRPVRDTLINIPMKMWGSELIRNGDFPFWMNTARYGFPTSGLQLISINSFLGLLLSWGSSYTLRTFVVESLLWQVIGAGGMYLLARQYLRLPVSAATAALSFVASGSVFLGGTLGTVEPSYAGVPWALLGVTWAAKAIYWRDRLRSVAILVFSYAWMATSGYPQTWLTLPIFAVPVVAILSASSRRNQLAALTTCAVGLSLALLIISPFITETIATPLFGGKVRPTTINPDEGAFPLVGIFGRLVANPTYTPGATEIYPGPVPLYIGLLGATVLPWRVASSLFHLIPLLRTIFVFVGVTLLSLASLPIGALHVNAQANVAATGFLFLLLSVSPLLRLSWRRDELALAALSLFVLVCASENPIGSVIRRSLPPFSWSRWSFGYLGIAVIPELILSWVTVERIVLETAGASRCVFSSGRLSAAIGLVGVATFVTCLVWLPGADPATTTVPGESRIGVLSLVWSAIVLAILATSTLVDHLTARAAYPFLLTSLSALLVSTLLVGTTLESDEALVHAYISLPGPGTLIADASHSTIVTSAILLVAAKPSRTKTATISALAAISALDVIAAKPRYLADTDMVLGGQPLHDLGSAPAFEFSGTTRDVVVTPFHHGRPGPSTWPTIAPQNAELEHAFGAPPLFDQFVYFPAVWTIVSPDSATFLPESLGRSPNPNLSLPVGPESSPTCPPHGSPDDPQPTATVTRFLSAYVRVTYDTACTRLLAYTDTWAKGWEATIDGDPEPVLHLNGAIRGVIAPAGSHVLEWTYRPAYWRVTKWVSLTSFLATLACLVSAWWPLSVRYQRRKQNSDAHVNE